ncbi:MAG TPA: AraC family transcriptional regulator [Ktedonobacterales bacterium]|nr:AraC family transcriptional regulator [Ktedonobacterales bacterium]
MLRGVYRPTPRLAPFVGSIWVYRSDQPEQVCLLPSGTAQLVIDLSGDGLPRPGPHPGSAGDSGPLSATPSRDAYAALLYGVDSAPLSLDNDRPVYEFGVDFLPGGLYPFFAPPASELHDLQLSLDAVWSTQVVRELRERVAEADTLEEQAGILEEVLVRQLVRPLAHHPAVTAALRALSVPRMPSAPEAPMARIAWVAEEAGLSRGHFTRLFQQEVGLTPKHYARVRRFLRVVQRLGSVGSVGSERRIHWARLALECGYYDQAHLINEFRAFSGVCPSAYLRARRVAPPSTRE